MRLELHNDALRLELRPDIGGSVSRFALHTNGHDIELFRKAVGNTVLNMSMFPMVPYCSRIRDNQFEVGGKRFQLKPNFNQEPLACHGDGWQNPWQVLETTATRAVLGLEYLQTEPYQYKAWQTFELEASRLVTTLRVRNEANDTMPFGLGFHPYFERTVKTLHMKTSSVWLEGPLHLPTERVTVPRELGFDPPAPLPNVWRNLCYSGWDGVARLEFADAALTIKADAQHIVLYTPPGENYFCLEPQSHCVNAFTMTETSEFQPGTVLLKPREELSFTVTFEI